MPDNAEETSPDPSDAKGSEATPDPALENQKLKLEVRLLERQLSKRWLALEWLKSGTVLVALIGVAVTLWVGFGQVKQAEQSRISERLDKALTRLASDKANERVTGVSSLRLFLSESDSSLRAQALHFLVDAAVVEADPLVQSAIQDVFAGMKKSEVSQAHLDSLLKTVIERNRSLANSIRSEWPERVRQDKRKKLASFARLNLKLDQIPNEIPQSLTAKLTLAEYLELLEAERGQFEMLEPKMETPLKGVSQLIITLLRLGAKATDFSRISCQWCDFSVTRDLSGANFDKANLEHANFSRVSLKGASFQEANLSDTIFFAADLSNANLKDNTLEVNWSEVTHGLPLFECANLKGADLSGTPLLVFNQSFRGGVAEPGAMVTVPRMLSSQIDKTTNLQYFKIIAVTVVSDESLTKHPDDGRFEELLKRGLSSVEQLFHLGRVPCTYRRLKDTSSYAADMFSNTTCIQLRRVGGDAYGMNFEGRSALSGFLDQPGLNEIPLLAAFNRSLEPRQRPRRMGVSEYACDDLNPPDPSKLKISADPNSDDY